MSPAEHLGADKDAGYGPALAASWDQLIGWEERARQHGPFVADTLRRHGARRVLDAAAGTGVHAIPLVEQGFEVVAADASEPMLACARAHARDRGLTLTTVRAAWRELPSTVDGLFDAALCLGNSWAHLLEAEARAEALRALRAVLRPGGVLLLDHRDADTLRRETAAAPSALTRRPDGVAVGAWRDTTAGVLRVLFRLPDGARVRLALAILERDETAAALRAAGFARVSTVEGYGSGGAPETPSWVVHVAEVG